MKEHKTHIYGEYNLYETSTKTEKEDYFSTHRMITPQSP